MSTLIPAANLAAALLQETRVVVIPYYSWITWIVVGLIAGWLAGVVARGRGFGCIADIILGLVGGIIGGWIFAKLGIVFYGILGSIAAAFVGAVIVVVIARAFSGGRD
jgi:uncharacterized membrane protein YeaQ/YmgE (transglycosylase-associated protein family)